METKTEKKENPLNTSEEIRNKAREELNRQLQGLLNDQPIEKLTDDNIEDEVNRLMEEVEVYEKNYIPKDIDENAFNELKKFEEEFGNDIEDDIEDEKDENNNSNNIKEKNEKLGETPSKKKTNFDLDLDLEDLEDIIEKDYKTNEKNKKSSNITQDKEIKELLNEYERQLDIEVAREVEREYKPKMDPNDVKRADTLLKNDPLLNEAIIQGIITREELILYIDYYEIFSLTTKAKKITSEHLKALDDLCIKNKQSSVDEDQSKQNNKKKEIDLNDEDAIGRLTSEIEKKLESSEDILNQKLDYEKIMMNSGNNNTKNVYNQNLKDILDKYNNNKENNDNRRSNKSAKSDKSNISSIANKTGFTNATNYTNKNKINNAFNINDDNKGIINDKEEKRPLTTKSEISTFTTEELMSVPKYSYYKNNNNNKKEKEKGKKQININSNINLNLNNNNNDGNSNSSNNKNNNKTFYNNNKKNINNNTDIEIHKPKTPLKPISKDKNKTYRNNTNNNNNLNVSNSFNNNNNSLVFVTGKKTIPPIKNNNINNLKSKTNQRFDLFDDDGNPLNLGKFRSTRKELVKLKMGGKSKMHELFTNKPRNAEENEKLRQKFMDFIQTGKENNKNGGDVNSLKKSIVRKKIEDAQLFNKIKK